MFQRLSVDGVTSRCLGEAVGGGRCLQILSRQELGGCRRQLAANGDSLVAFKD